MRENQQRETAYPPEKYCHCINEVYVVLKTIHLTNMQYNSRNHQPQTKAFHSRFCLAALEIFLRDKMQNKKLGFQAIDCVTYTSTELRSKLSSSKATTHFNSFPVRVLHEEQIKSRVVHSASVSCPHYIQWQMVLGNISIFIEYRDILTRQYIVS